MTCEFCGSPYVVIKFHDGTGKTLSWDMQGEIPHNCPIPTVYCPTCQKRMLQTNVCDHYKALKYKPGENEQFFIRKILHPPQPKQPMKRIGTSAGNTRTKNTRCTKCGKDLNGWKAERVTQHEQDHLIQEEKNRPQTRLFS